MNLNEKIIIILSSVLAILSSTMIYLDMDPLDLYDPIEYRTRKEIGEVSTYENIAKIKHHNSPVWSSISQNNPLYNQDHIFTDTNSSLSILFKQGDYIDIGENSLIVIDSDTIFNNINIFKGEVFAKTGKSKIKIKTKKGIAKIAENSELRINVGDKKEEISINKGKIEYTDNNKNVTTVKENNQLIIKEKTEIRKISTKLIHPRHKQEIYFTNDNDYLELIWENITTDSKKQVDIKVEVAKDKNFENIVISERTKDNKIKIQDKEGIYYWRVEGNSNTNSFTLIKNTPPKIYKPYSKQQLKFLQGESQSVIIDWEDQNDISYYNLVIAKDKNFEKVLYKNKFNNPPFIYDKLTSGDYFLKIQAVSEKRKSNLWSEIIPFSIKIIELPVIKLLSPDINHKFILTETDKTIIHTWSSCCMKYIVQIADNSNFNNPIINTTTDTENFGWTPVKHGQFFWRVKPIDDFKRKTIYTKENSYRVGIPAISLKIKQETANRIRFSWNKEMFVRYFKIIISDNKNFSNYVIKTKTTKNFFVWQNKKGKSYYFRLSAYDDNDNKIDESKISKFTFIDVPTLKPVYELQQE